MCVVWTDHARDHVLEHQSRPWPAQAPPITPVTKKKGKENFARGGHALSSRTWPWWCTTITAVRNPVTTARLPLLSPLLHHVGDQFSWTWSRPWSSCSIMITPVTISTRHDHARDQCPVFSYVLLCFSNVFYKLLCVVASQNKYICLYMNNTKIFYKLYVF